MSEIKRYLIDEHDLEPETELALYRTTLAWAAERGERFIFVLQPDLYDEPAEVKLLTSLGSVTFYPEVRGSDNWISRNLAKLFGNPKERLQVEGSPNDTFVQILTSMTAPPRAIAGDLSPVEDVEIFIGGPACDTAASDSARDRMLPFFLPVNPRGGTFMMISP